MNTKVCGQCKNEKEVSCFYKDKYTKDGYNHKCIDCCTKWRNSKENLQRKREADKRWYHSKGKYSEDRKAKKRNYQKKMNKQDEKFNLKHRLRVRLHHAFEKYSNGLKIGKSADYGIDWQSIIEHIGPCPGERKDYHIDHIVPLCSFDFDNKEEVRQAFAPENHQWLTKEENLKKNKCLPPKDEDKIGG